MEHFCYTPHPKDFCLPNSCFARVFWVMWIVRHGGVGWEQVLVCEHDTVRTIQVAQRIHRDTLPSHYH